MWRMASFAMNWAPLPVRNFCKAAEAFLDMHGPSQVQTLQNDFKELFGDTGVLQELVNIYLQRVLEGRANDGDAVIGNDNLVITYSPKLTVRILKDRTDMFAFNQMSTNTILMNYPSNSLVLIDCEEPLRVDWYCLEEGADFDRFDSSLKIRHETTATCEKGSVLYVEARRRFPVMPARPSDTFAVLSGPRVNAQIVTFDADTLRPIGASMSSEISSTLCVMLDLVQPDQPDYPLDAVLALTRHPDHHVRWAAVAALGKHNRDVALDLIVQLKESDPHQFIRDAARLTLQRCAEAA
jgi:hypothetical protein